MAEETTAREQATGSEQSTEPSIKDILAQLDAVKQAQSGSDKKVKELSDALTKERQAKEELLKERMTEKEKAAYEQEQVKKALEQKDAEIRARELALERANVITELEVPKGLAPFVTGKDRTEMISNAKALIDALKAEAASEVNKRLAGGATPPKAGDGGSGYTLAQLDDPATWASVWKMPPGPEKDKKIADMQAAAARLSRGK
jgi:hypothetical protein